MCPGEPNLLSLLGAALNRQGRAAEAEPQLRRALEEEPGYAKGHEELGRSLLQLGRSDEAIDEPAKALALDPKLQARAARRWFMRCPSRAARSRPMAPCRRSCAPTRRAS